MNKEAVIKMWADGTHIDDIMRASDASEDAIRSAVVRARKVGDERAAPRAKVDTRNWSPEKDARLAELWERGDSASSIAALLSEEFGQTSRNAVLGRRLRLKLPSRERMTTSKLERRKTRVRADRRARHRARTAPAIVPSAVSVAPIQSRHVGLLDLAYDDCRYPYGTGPYTFCALPAHDGSPYCAEHHAIIYQSDSARPA